MKTTEFSPLTQEAVARLLSGRQSVRLGKAGPDRRKTPRWPFPGTVELWIPRQDGLEDHVIATSFDLSLHGIGIRCDVELSPNLELGIAIHEPEMSFHGRAVVRHCTCIEEEFLAGLQFIDKAE